ncbi:hypothetical protein [Jonesia quinghaiensis]|uniref:hypothetical protein n=1 Tax=Jonesia quinghaiensis TaxID=262806 RepID=UPI00040C65FC|nr:hypothetical protein [Jonesia quinghaiensis]
MNISRTIAAVAVVGLSIAGTAACSSEETPTTETSATQSAQPTDTQEPEATDDAEQAPDTDAPSTSAPEWAVPATNPGDKIATAEGEGFTVDVYQVGTATASKTGNFVDPDTNKPIIAEGDEVVYVNYVFTNTGDADIALSYSLVEVDARYADWPYMQGMDSVTDTPQAEEMDIVSSAIAPGGGEAPFVWSPGQSFSYGENFRYQSGSDITFAVKLTPVDAAGDLIHDERQEVTADATIS